MTQPVDYGRRVTFTVHETRATEEQVSVEDVFRLLDLAGDAPGKSDIEARTLARVSDAANAAVFPPPEDDA